MTRYFKQPIHCYGKMGMESLEGSDFVAHMVLQRWITPLAADPDYVLNDATCGAGSTSVKTTFLNQPDYARNVTMVCSGTCTGNATVAGVDARGNSITETLALTSGTPKVFAKAFASITSITLPDATGITVDVGIGNVLGLLRVPITFAAEALVNGVLETTAATLNATNSTVDFNTDPSGSVDHVLKYWTSEVA